MRRITLWLLSTVAAVVLLFSYRTSTMGTGSGTSAAAPDGEAATDSGGSTGSTGSTDSTGSTTSNGDGTTYKGSVAQTRWGPVQVTITVSDGKIAAVSVPTYPNSNGRDREINAYALPILKQETLTAQNADIDSVSGATVTSNGYKQSLQAALDAAHLS
jgi:uncharacterized protein with FMN-binding domain